MIKRISLEEIKRSCQELVNRFPAALVFLSLLTLWMILHVWDKVYTYSEYLKPEPGVWFKLTDIQDGTIFYYLSIATVLSIVLKFWGEEVSNQRAVRIANVLSHLFLIADACFLWFRPEGSFYTELLLAHGAFITALIIAGIFLPFFRERDDLSSWNLTLRMTAFAFICPISCGIVAGGLSLLLHSFDWLFGIKINDHWYGTLTAILMLTVAGGMWMSRLPKGEEKFFRTALTSKFLTGLVRYLFLPLVLGYLVVLYVYGAKILLAMELPKGGVCLLVIVLMIGCLSIEFLLYPLQRKAEIEGGKSHIFERWLVRWLPIIILPLLVLMSVAIGRRISDYGITVDRLYVLTLNLWFYAVCIGLYLSSARRIHWVTLSFGALFLLTSALPVNFCSITLQTIEKRIEDFLSSHDRPALPMTEDSYTAYMENLTSEEAESLREDLQYIRSLYDTKTIARFVDKKVNLWRSFTAKEDVVSSDSSDYIYEQSGFMTVPEGYREFRDLYAYEKVNKNDSTQWHITVDDTLTFMIDVEQLPSTDSISPYLLPELNGKGVLSVSELEIRKIWNDSLESNLSLRGYLFR